MRTEYVVVVCKDSSGMPVAPVFEIIISPGDYEMGYHYDRAIEEAINDGFEADRHSICFDNAEHSEIVGAGAYLSELHAGGLINS